MYTPLTDEQIKFMSTNNIRPWYFANDEETYQIGIKLIGSVVCKSSKKPFKGGSTFNTVSGLVRNPHTMHWAFTFYEDDSCVDVKSINLKVTE